MHVRGRVQTSPVSAEEFFGSINARVVHLGNRAFYSASATVCGILHAAGLLQHSRTQNRPLDFARVPL